MEYFTKDFNIEDDGFDGNIEAYLIDTNRVNLKNWLEKEVFDYGKIYNVIREHTNEILIIKNINVDEEFRNQGFGNQILSEALNDSCCNAAILLCDTSEQQQNGFNLEKFYNDHNFDTIYKYGEYPLMVYPQDLAKKIKNNLINMKRDIMTTPEIKELKKSNQGDGSSDLNSLSVKELSADKVVTSTTEQPFENEVLVFSADRVVTKDCDGNISESNYIPSNHVSNSDEKQNVKDFIQEVIRLKQHDIAKKRKKMLDNNLKNTSSTKKTNI